MHHSIPRSALDADQILHDILRTVAFSRHLNPSNATAARAAFLAGAEAPPFEYLPLQNADEILRTLDRAEPERDHPAGELVGRCMDGTRLLVCALRDRTADRFDEMARAAEWYPSRALMDLTFPDAEPDNEPMDVSAVEVAARLRRRLRSLGLDDWHVVDDTVMSARVLVDGAKRLLRINPRARFHQRDLERLTVHEVDVHVLRSANGQAQTLRCFETGLPGSLDTEEGLAMVAEERAGFASPGVLARQVEVVRAIDHARRAGFREVHDTIAATSGRALAWGICLRIKRGLANPGEPGVYAKDVVYLRGRMLVSRWLDEGGELSTLYVGKVGLGDPVREWLDQGWIKPPRAIPDWTRLAA